ncbi:Uncharacterised protein [Mycobacterium tuberculosis]|nr:Uncharacterised protein [Mycobacterium tuberculosis]
MVFTHSEEIHSDFIHQLYFLNDFLKSLFSGLYISCLRINLQVPKHAYS